MWILVSRHSCDLREGKLTGSIRDFITEEEEEHLLRKVSFGFSSSTAPLVEERLER